MPYSPGKTAVPPGSLFFLLPHGRVAFLHNLALVEHGMQAIVHSLDGSKDDSYHQAVHSSNHQAGGQDLEMTIKLGPFSQKHSSLEGAPATTVMTRAHQFTKLLHPFMQQYKNPRQGQPSL